jgi:hypothetical protein
VAKRIVHFRLNPPKVGTGVTVDMPHGAEPFDVMLVRGAVWVFVRCDPELPYERHTFHVITTGQVVPEREDLPLVGTVVIPGAPELQGNGDIALHVFHVPAKRGQVD